MSVFEDLGNLITNAQGAVDSFNSQLASLDPLLGEEDEEINLDDYIRIIVDEYLSQPSETQDSDNSSGSNPKLYAGDLGIDEVDDGIQTFQEKGKYNTIIDLKGEKNEDVDPVEKIRDEMTKLQAELNAKMEATIAQVISTTLGLQIGVAKNDNKIGGLQSAISKMSERVASLNAGRDVLDRPLAGGGGNSSSAPTSDQISGG